MNTIPVNRARNRFGITKVRLRDVGYSQREFARKCGVDEASVSNFFAGRFEAIGRRKCGTIRRGLVDVGAITPRRSRTRIKVGYGGCAK
jgi:hypothetical protein